MGEHLCKKCWQRTMLPSQVCPTRQALQLVHQEVLHVGNLRSLATHANGGTSDSIFSLLALEHAIPGC
jgi:hypothetical protein